MAISNPYNYSRPAASAGVKRQPSVRPVKTTAESQNNDKYLEQKILTAKPEELTLMLFEGLVKFIKKAVLFNDEGNVDKTHQMIMRGQAILVELRSTLNMDYEVSKQLDSMYDYMIERLTEGNLRKENAILNEVEGLAKELRDTWKQAMPNMR